MMKKTPTTLPALALCGRTACAKLESSEAPHHLLHFARRPLIVDRFAFRPAGEIDMASAADTWDQEVMRDDVCFRFRVAGGDTPQAARAVGQGEEVVSVNHLGAPRTLGGLQRCPLYLIVDFLKKAGKQRFLNVQPIADEGRVLAKASEELREEKSPKRRPARRELGSQQRDWSKVWRCDLADRKGSGLRGEGSGGVEPTRGAE